MIAGVTSAVPAHIIIKEIVVAAPAVVSKDAATNAPLALIIEPTRELALQTADVIRSLMRHIAEPALRMVRACSHTV